jgi:hypothetical protein
LTDEDNGLKLLQKLIRFVDLKLIALLISRYVEIQIFEEPTENPPGAGFHTPDKGYTWLGIHAPDADKHFLLARLFALIFETEAELFYQLINIPNVSTEAVLEEESFQERTKRLSAEGIPDAGWASRINSPISLDRFSQLLSENHRGSVSDIAVIEPLIYESLALQPLSSFLEAVRDRETAEMEITLIANAAVVHWGVDFGDQSEVVALLERVKGALNIGLELALQSDTRLDQARLAQSIGLQPLFQLGLGELLSLKKSAVKSTQRTSLSGIDERHVEILRGGVIAPFPQAPLFLNRRGDIDQGESGEVPTTLRAFEHLTEIAGVKRLLGLT